MGGSGGRARWAGLLGAVLFTAATAWAGPTDEPDARVLVPRAYERAVELVETLYLEPDTIDPPTLLRSAAEGLARDVPWLMLEATEAGGVRLRHGAGRVIGEAHAEEWEALPVALFSLEDAVRRAGLAYGPVDLRLSVLAGMTQALDRYSRVLAGDKLVRFDTRLSGTLVGIGVTVGPVHGDLVIKEVVPDGPADRGGVEVGDVLLRVDDVSAVGMSGRDAAALLRGAKGEPVVVTVSRAPAGGGEPVHHALRLVRDEIVVPNVEHEVLDGGVAYVRIKHVSKKTSDNLARAFRTLQEQGALGRGLVLDLRGNTGGSMKESAAVVDRLVPEGRILDTLGRDGRPVRNLMSRIDAERSPDEPPVPVVVLVDDRTASGAEIIAGALQAFDRAVLVGQRSYGKGKVQKIYDLDEGVRLKLTVAEYVLVETLRVAEVGLVPDVTLGEIVLDDDGVRFDDGWDLERERVAWDDVVPVVDEREGWRGLDRPPPDLALEIARRTVLAAEGPDKAVVLEALRREVEAARGIEEGWLVDALQARGLDWRAADAPGAAPEADVAVALHPTDDPERFRVEARVTNLGPSALRRSLVRLTSPSFGEWDDLVIPIGVVAPGTAARGEVTVDLRPAIEPRADTVAVELRADRRPALAVGEQTLEVRTTDEPSLRLEARLEEGEDGAVVVVGLRNLHPVSLRDIEVHLAHPEDAGLELREGEQVLEDLGPDGVGAVRFHVRLDEPLDTASTDRVPLHVRADVRGFGDLVDWDILVPLDGQTVAYEAPRIEARHRQFAGPAGQALRVPLDVSDDERVDGVAVFLNGRKLDWVRGDGASVRLVVDPVLEAGSNLLVVEARDRDGLRARRTWHLLGVGAASVDGTVRQDDEGPADPADDG